MNGFDAREPERDPRAPAAAWVKTLVFTVVFPGTVAGLVPHLLAGEYGQVAGWEPGWLAWVGWGALVMGVAGYLACAREFVTKGWGTPAVYDPPERLVVTGLYRMSRNPMYTSVLLIILGQALIRGSGVVLGHGIAIAYLFYSFVRWFEEPRLAERFGAEYDRYRARVPRWFGVPRAQEPSRREGPP